VTFSKDLSSSHDSSVCLLLLLLTDRRNKPRVSVSKLLCEEAEPFPARAPKDTDSHKMETPLGKQTLCCDYCYLITAGKCSCGSPFFFPILCQHFGKANISVTTLPALESIWCILFVTTHVTLPRWVFHSRRNYSSPAVAHLLRAAQ